jgi:hypothetical protein
LDRKIFSISPFALSQRHLNLQRILFVESGVDTEWAILQTLKAQIFEIVIFYVDNFEVTSLRRIQLAVEKSGVVAIWLTEKPRGYWPISLQLGMRKKESGLEPCILKQKL